MRTSIIKELAALGIGMTATLLLGAASPDAGGGVAQGTGMQATETQATGTQSFDRDTLVRENGQKMTGTSPGSDPNAPTTPAAETEVAAPATQGSHNPWHDEEAALFRLEFRKAMQRAKSDLTERETQHTSDMREIERAAAKEEHELDVLRWIRQGATAYDAKDLPMALENLRQADLLQPRSGTLLSLLSLAYGDMGYSGKALECAQRAISQEPDGYLPLLVLGISHAHLNEFEQAIAALRALNLCKETRISFWRSASMPCSKTTRLRNTGNCIGNWRRKPRLPWTHKSKVCPSVKRRSKRHPRHGSRICHPSCPQPVRKPKDIRENRPA